VEEAFRVVEVLDYMGGDEGIELGYPENGKLVVEIRDLPLLVQRGMTAGLAIDGEHADIGANGRLPLTPDGKPASAGTDVEEVRLPRQAFEEAEAGIGRPEGGFDFRVRPRKAGCGVDEVGYVSWNGGHFASGRLGMRRTLSCGG
jgi:hypothetical protein